MLYMTFMEFREKEHYSECFKKGKEIYSLEASSKLPVSVSSKSQPQGGMTCAELLLGKMYV